MNMLFDDYEGFREAGHELIEQLISFYKEDLSKLPLPVSVDKNSVIEANDFALPLGSGDIVELTKNLVSENMYCAVHQNHPRYVATVPGPSAIISALGDFIASGFNTFAGNWSEGAGVVTLEHQVINWMCQILDFPTGSGGILTPSGTLSNLTALVAARENNVNSRNASNHNNAILLSAEAHFTFERICTVMGIPRENLVKVRTDASGSMDLANLRSIYKECLSKSLNVFCVVANAGTINTGAVDDFVSIREFCDEYKLWMHVDGAMGAAGILDNRNKNLFTGIYNADSVTIDFHKWWFQSYESSALIFKDVDAFYQTYAHSAAYIDSLKVGDLDPYDLGIQLTRYGRSIKAWLTFKTLGIEHIGKAITLCHDNSKKIAQALEKDGNWKIITGPQLATFTFVAIDNQNNEVSEEKMESIINLVEADTRAGILGTKIKDKSVIRICTINPQITINDIEIILDVLNEARNKVVNFEVSRGS